MSSKIVFGVALALASLSLASVGFAEDTPTPHVRQWPIQNGHNYQPTDQELRALHREDITPDQAREVDRLYDQLLAGTEPRNRRSAPKR